MVQFEKHPVVIIYIVLAVIRWMFLLIANMLFLNGTSNSAQVAFLVFSFIDIATASLFVAALCKPNGVIKSVFLTCVVILSVVHIITASCAIFLKDTIDSEKARAYTAGAAFGLIGAIITVPAGVFFFLSASITHAFPGFEITTNVYEY